MAPAVTSWSQSPHANVACASCHETPTPWYGYPKRLALRATSLSQDVYWHLTGTGEVTKTADAPAIPDSACTKCHDPNRTPSSRGGVIIDHAAHAKLNRSCLSCHLDTAHPDSSAESALLMMEQCFTCHGQSASAKAPGTCKTCHPDYFPLPPSTHKATTWRSAHGKAAKANRDQCAMCHKASFCSDCHGLKMPHPTGWTRGPTGHSAVAKRDRDLCTNCHTGKPNPCSSCHHQAFELEGQWLEVHPAAVHESGTARCMQCHAADFCGNCHRRTERE